LKKAVANFEPAFPWSRWRCQQTVSCRERWIRKCFPIAFLIWPTNMPACWPYFYATLAVVLTIRLLDSRKLDQRSELLLF